MLRFILKFVGGPLDGKTVSGHPGELADEAHKYYALSYHGRLGQRFRVASEYAVDVLAEEELGEERPHGFQPHVYEVIDRIDNGDVLLVQASYVERQPQGRR